MSRLIAPSRRMVLRSALGSLALPPLLSALPRSAWATEGAPPKRILFYYVPNGIQPEVFIPQDTGPDWVADPLVNPSLVPLAPIRHKVAVLSGLKQVAAIDDFEGDHARGTGAFLTCSPIKFTAGNDIDNDVSIDQHLANGVAGSTPFPSLQVGTEPGGSTGDCNAGYSCAYTRNISWSGPSTPLPPINDPSLLFERLFGSADGLDPVAAARRNALRVSVLDHVVGQIGALDARLSSSDRLKLDEFLTGVRELEALIGGLQGGTCDPGGLDTSWSTFDVQLAITHQLMALALQCDLTRVVTFISGQSASNRTFSFIGVPDAHHQLSHHQFNATQLEKMYQVNAWFVEQYANLLLAMDSVIESDGSTLLDNSAVYFASEVSDGNTHSHYELPVLVGGGLGGALALGSHHRFSEAARPFVDPSGPQLVLQPGGRPMADVFLTLADAFGVPLATFGDGNGPIPELLA
jgi:hypothetical protein